MTYNLQMPNDKSTSLIFYKSKKPNPIFTTEEGVEKIIGVVLNAGKVYPPEERALIINVKFGGTYIDVKALHEKSGNYITVNLKYD